MDPSCVEPVRVAGYVANTHDLDAVVGEIREIERRNGLDRTVALGRLVLQRFFGGSVNAWRERRRNKNNSVRRLAQHPACPLSRSAINQAIGIFVALQSLACDQTFGHMGPSHIAAVLHLNSRAQRHWLERADREGWGVRELKEHVTQQRRETGERRGRPRLAEKGKAISEIRKVIRILEKAVTVLERADLHLRDRGELGVLVTRLASAEEHLARAFRGPMLSEPCLASVPEDETHAVSLKNVG